MISRYFTTPVEIRRETIDLTQSDNPRTWASVGTVRGWLDEPKTRRVAGPNGERYATMRPLLCAPGSNIRQGDAVVHEGTEYRVVQVDPARRPGGAVHHLTVQLEELRGGA